MVKLEVDEDFFLLIHISIVSKQNEKTSAFTMTSLWSSISRVTFATRDLEPREI